MKDVVIHPARVPLPGSVILRSRARLIAGWVAVGISTLFSCLWAFWGSIENFHEGWFHREWYLNVRLALVQYLPWMFLPMAAGLVGLWRRWPGLLVHLALAATAVALFGWRLRAGMALIAMPLAGLGALYLFGRAQPVSWARRLLITLPLLTSLVSGAYPAWRVFTRPPEVDLESHRLAANGIDLIWAPAGPGWPDSGFAWAEAQRRCAYLSDDGASLADTPQQIWRLPTVDEAVRSQVFRGANAGGVWDIATHTARYRVMPDKEAPLWNRYSQVIYWWTADEASTTHAYRVVYDGLVNAVPKSWGPAYLACRCVKSPR